MGLALSESEMFSVDSAEQVGDWISSLELYTIDSIFIEIAA